jgi:2,4-dienoyl-CoA reductase-like NADH-dependent reductase (Old Yellow Enzyme family)
MTVTSASAEPLLFTPFKIANGKIELSHRVVLAPMTRNRHHPLNTESTPENPNRIWYPDDVVTEYYEQRATPGGLLITEGISPSLQVRSVLIYEPWALE